MKKLFKKSTTENPQIQHLNSWFNFKINFNHNFKKSRKALQILD